MLINLGSNEKNSNMRLRSHSKKLSVSRKRTELARNSFPTFYNVKVLIEVLLHDLDAPFPNIFIKT
jgi:hypothetical protein